MARGKAEKQPFQMDPSLRQHLFSVQRYSSNTGQVQNMSMLLEVTVAPLQCWGWHKVVRVEVEEECRVSGCQRWNSSTTAGAWTSVWGSHMLSELDQPMNLTRYHSLPHLNLESRISSTSYSSWSLTVIGPGCRGCRCSAISSGA